jgi:hypothetical protein
VAFAWGDEGASIGREQISAHRHAKSEHNRTASGEQHLLDFMVVSRKRKEGEAAYSTKTNGDKNSNIIYSQVEHFEVPRAIPTDYIKSLSSCKGDYEHQ